MSNMFEALAELSDEHELEKVEDELYETFAGTENRRAIYRKDSIGVFLSEDHTIGDVPINNLSVKSAPISFESGDAVEYVQDETIQLRRFFDNTYQLVTYTHAETPEDVSDFVPDTVSNMCDAYDAMTAE